MFRARNRTTVEAVAHEHGLPFIGFTVFGGDWFAARTRDELARAGCAEVLELPVSVVAPKGQGVS